MNGSKREEERRGQGEEEEMRVRGKNDVVGDLW